jgi:hypothetical protein
MCGRSFKTVSAVTSCAGTSTASTRHSSIGSPSGVLNKGVGMFDLDDWLDVFSLGFLLVLLGLLFIVLSGC